MTASPLTVLVNAGPVLPILSASGGVESVINALVPALRERGVRVVLATVTASTIEADEILAVFDEPQH
ncbi:MAG TPA: hypothetical protein VGX23_18950 [Actinocrinis sp.]|nr:hypothetical protein [Actinocrinis sp.]